MNLPVLALRWTVTFLPAIDLLSIYLLMAEASPVSYETETAEGKRMQRVVSAAGQAAVQCAPHLTELDQLVGDGDLGSNMARAAEVILGSLNTIPFDRPAEALKALGLAIQKALGGSSGPFYGAFLLRAGT